MRRIFIILGFLIFILFFSFQFLSIAVAQAPIPIPPPPSIRTDTPPPPSSTPAITEVTPEPTDPEPPLPPCANFDANGKCTSVNTALGEIGTTPEGFIKSVFGWILGLSGGVALLLIIYSGYKLMAARGEPEALKDARDQLIAAIVGLVFIIFSLVILQIIGVDVLKIPGFGN